MESEYICLVKARSRKPFSLHYKCTTKIFLRSSDFFFFIEYLIIDMPSNGSANIRHFCRHSHTNILCSKFQYSVLQDQGNCMKIRWWFKWENPLSFGISLRSLWSSIACWPHGGPSNLQEVKESTAVFLTVDSDCRDVTDYNWLLWQYCI